jgi:thioredoxin 1
MKMNESEFYDKINGDGVFIVDFWAEWCGPCRAVTPIIEELAEEAGIELIKVNIDENFDIAQREGVQSIPMIRLYKDGVNVTSSLGSKPKSQLKAVLGL